MLKPAILFDVDGTLVDSNDAHVEAWQRAFAGEGYAFSRAQIHAQIGKGADNLVPCLFPQASDDTRERLDRAHGEIYKRDFLPLVQPFGGAKQFLRSLVARGHTLVLASSASRTEVAYYIELLEADGLLSGTTSKDEVESSKPCPDIFAAALALTGWPAARAVVIGDTPYDIIAARRAGIDAIAVLAGGFDYDDLQACQPLAIYQDVAELSANYLSSPLTDAQLAGTI